MGLIELNRCLSVQRDLQQRRWQIRASDELIASDGEDSLSTHITECSIPHLDDSRNTHITECSMPQLPQDIWFHVHCLLPIRDAARAACLSHAFLQSWRCRPTLILTKDTIDLDEETDSGAEFGHIVARILRNHSGVGLKVLKIDYMGVDEFNEFDASRYLDRRLPHVVKPGLEELTVMLRQNKREYNFPCSLLSGGVQNSIRYLELGYCALRPTAQLSPLRCLTSLLLRSVSIMGDELELILSNSLALQRLDLTYCMEIVCLKVPCILQRFSCLKVFECRSLKLIEIKAPNLSSFFFRGNRVNFLLDDASQMKKLNLHRSNLVHYARTELPSTMPNLETLYIGSRCEVSNTPMLLTKFLHLKSLSICLVGLTSSPSYDYFSLVSFLDASPSLENLVMDVTQKRMDHESVFANSDLRDIPEHRHVSLKNVTIIGFNSAKSLVELACYILKNTVSLECLTLDTIYGDLRCYLNTSRRCNPMCESILMEARRAVMAIRTYIEDKVPSTVKFTVFEPCSRCHVRGFKL